MTWLAHQQRVQIDELDTPMVLRRTVPGDHAHAAAERDARHFRGDAAKADQAERLAGQLHAVLAQPVAGAHLAVHQAMLRAAAHISAIADSATAVSP